jgi:hypothetical protein
MIFEVRVVKTTYHTDLSIFKNDVNVSEYKCVAVGLVLQNITDS